MADYTLLKNVILGSSASQIDSGSGLDAKDFLFVEFYATTAGGNINCNFTFNGDTNQNYAIREQIDASSASTNVNLSNTDNLTGTVNGDIYATVFIVNKSDQAKLFYSLGQERPANSNNAGNRKIITGKWVNESAQITQVTANSSANYGSNSYLRIYGAEI